MNCERFQTVASDLARHELMEADDRASALAHVDQCDRCAQTWSDQRELTEGLRSVARQMNSLQAPAQLEEGLRAAFRDRARVRPVPAVSQRWRYWATAVAAALLIAFSVIAWRAHVASPTQPAIEATRKGGVVAPAESPKADQSSGVAASQNQGPDKSAAPNRLPAKHNPPSFHRPSRGSGVALANRPPVESATGLTANADTREVTTDFVALGYGNAMDLQDGGQLVRVELPRSALARFGLPMNMNRADERVKADVLVGADGLARAIRFVK